MSRSRPHARVLRVALLVDGQLVAERLVRPGRPVSVGTDPACALVLPGDGPRRIELFRPRRRREQHWLLLRPDQTGRVQTADEGTMDLAMLALRRQAPARRGAHEIALQGGDRGKVVLGDAAVLFQYVPAPPVALRTLDQDFRPRLLDADDPRFLGILGAVSGAAAAALLWVASVEPPALVTPEEIPDYIAHITIEAPPVPPPAVEEPPPPPPDPAGVPVQRAAPDPTPQSVVAVADPIAAAQRVEGRRGEVRQAALFAAISDDPDGVFSERDDGMAAVAEHLRGLEVTAEMHGEGPVLRRRGARDGDGDRGIGGVGTGGPGPDSVVAEVAPPAGTARVADLDLPGLDPDDPDDASLIRDTVRRGAPGVQDCYTRQLKLDPTLEGRLVVQFDITVGKVLGVQIPVNGTRSADLEACVTRRVRTWRFDRTVTATRVEVPFALVPSG